ncbi:amidase [Oceanithermus sp.]
MSYDLKDVKLPVLTGRALRAFAASLEKPLLGPALLGKLMADAGLPRLRSLTGLPDPLYHPSFPAPPQEEADSRPLRSWLGRRQPAARPPADPPPAPAPFRGVGDYLRAYREGTADPEEVAGRFLEAYARLNPTLRAFVAVNPDDVRRQAAAAAARWRSGKTLGPLDGVPVAVKDEIDVAGYPTTVGTSFLNRVADHDATVVARLRAAGAVIVGKTNMHEIGINPTGYNVHHGHVRNPYDPGRDPGGSSSGSAAAVASGLVPLALGADGGGSIRVPAALTGINGIKATYGGVSEKGAFPLCWSVAHVGPLAADVAGAELAHRLIAGPDPADPHTRAAPTPRPADLEREDLRGLRVGYWPAWFEHADDTVVAAARAGLERLREAGAELVEVELPGLDDARIAHAVTILAEMADSMNDYPDHWRDLAPATRINLLVGRGAGALDYLNAQRVRAAALEGLEAALGKADLLATPTTAITAPPMPASADEAGISDLTTVTRLMRFVFLTNLTGHPALSTPVGYDDAGLPVGLQLIGPAWSEPLLFETAAYLERTLRRLPPQVFVDLLEG